MSSKDQGGYRRLSSHKYIFATMISVPDHSGNR